jgi:hypothetical protein
MHGEAPPKDQRNAGTAHAGLPNGERNGFARLQPPWGRGSLQEAKTALAFSQTCAKCTMDLRLGPSPPHDSFLVGHGPARVSFRAPLPQ